MGGGHCYSSNKLTAESQSRVDICGKARANVAGETPTLLCFTSRISSQIASILLIKSHTEAPLCRLCFAQCKQAKAVIITGGGGSLMAAQWDLCLKKRGLRSGLSLCACSHVYVCSYFPTKWIYVFKIRNC